MGFTRFWWVQRGFTRFGWVLLDLTRFDWILQGFFQVWVGSFGFY